MSESTSGEHLELVERFQAKTNPFQQRNPKEAAREVEPQTHVYRPGAICETEKRGYATPRNLDFKNAP